MSINIGARLKAVRKSKGIKQLDAASALGISHGLLSHYENGIRQPGLDFVCAASRYYGVTTDYLLGMADINASLPPRDTAPSIAQDFQELLDIVTGVYSLVSIINDPDLSASIRDYIGSSIYRIFRPLFDIHGIQYDASFILNSDTFSLCSAASLLSETYLLLQVRQLPADVTERLHNLSLEKEIPLNYASFFENMKKVDARIISCNPDRRFLDTYEP